MFETRVVTLLRKPIANRNVPPLTGGVGNRHVLREANGLTAITAANVVVP
jgi:hypothetical protein